MISHLLWSYPLLEGIQSWRIWRQFVHVCSTLVAHWCCHYLILSVPASAPSASSQQGNPSWLEAFLEALLVSKDNKLCQSGSSDWQSLLTQKFEIPNLKLRVIDCAFLILSQWQKTSFNRECPLLTTRKNSGLRHFSISFFFQTPRRSPPLGPLRPEVVDLIWSQKL